MFLFKNLDRVQKSNQLFSAYDPRSSFIFLRRVIIPLLSLSTRPKRDQMSCFFCLRGFCSGGQMVVWLLQIFIQEVYCWK